MNYIIAKQEKSVGLSILLTLIFGPIGLFYSTVMGGLIMTFVAPLVFVLIAFIGFGSLIFESPEMLLGSLVTFFFVLAIWNGGCIIWGIIAVNSYNDKLRKDVQKQNFLQKEKNSNLPNQNGLKKCEHCAELIQKDAKICRFCNREVNNVIEQQVSVPLVETFEVEAVPNDYKEITNYKKPEKNNNKIIILSSIIAVTIALGILGYVFKDKILTVEQSEENISISGKYPFTNARKVSDSELNEYSKKDLRIMRNEIFARHGFIFKEGSDLDIYFNNQDWYSEKPNFDNGVLSDIEKFNVDKILKAEQESSNTLISRPKDISIIEDSNSDFDMLKVTGNNVNIRKKPLISSEIVETTQEYDELYYLGYRTKLKEKINGKKDYWYKVSTPNNGIGWVFGAYVREPLPLEKIIE